MKSLPRGPRGISRNELSQKSWKSPQNSKKNSKKIQNEIFSIEFMFSKFRMFGNNTKKWLVILKNKKKKRKILTNCWKFSDIFIFIYIFKCLQRKFSIFEVLGKFWRGLEEPRSCKIYSSGNRGVKKGPGPRGSRDEEFLVPSLVWNLSTLVFFFLSRFE